MEAPGLELSGSCSESNSSIFEPLVQLQVLQSPVGGGKEQSQRRKASEQQRHPDPDGGDPLRAGYQTGVSLTTSPLLELLQPSLASLGRLWQVCGRTLELDPKHYPEGAEDMLLSQSCLGTECQGRTCFAKDASSAAMTTGCSSSQKSPPEFHCVKVWHSGSLVGGFTPGGDPSVPVL